MSLLKLRVSPSTMDSIETSFLYNISQFSIAEPLPTVSPEPIHPCPLLDS